MSNTISHKDSANELAEEIGSVTRSGRWSGVFRAWPVALVGVLLLPLLIYFGYQVQPFSVQNGIDPFIYVGYQESLGDLIDRFGYTYFAVRFGLLLPAHFLSSAFGAVPGYFVLRYVLAVLAAATLYWLGRSYGQRAAGWLGAVLCLASPIFLGAVMTVYADTVGLPCLIVAVALLLMKSGHPALRWLVAGAFIGVALNANLFVVGPLAGAVLCRAAVQLLRREGRELLAQYSAVGLGAAIVTAAGALYYGLQFGDPRVLSPSIDAIRQYSGEGGLSYRSPTHHWLSFSPHLYVPAIVGLALGCLLITGARRRGFFRGLLRSGSADALALLAGAQLFFFIHQFILDGYSMETFYYYSYLFAFVFVAIVFVGIEIGQRSAYGTLVVWVCVSLALALPAIRNAWGRDLEIWLLPTIPLLALAVALLLLVSGRMKLIYGIALPVLVVSVMVLGMSPPRNVPASPGQAFRWDPHYDLVVGNADRTGLHYYQAAAELSTALPRWSDDPGSLLFWYRNEPGLLNAVQSTHLWRTSSIQAGAPGLPTLHPDQISQLDERTPRHIAILATVPEDLDLGRALLEQAIPATRSEDMTVGARSARVYVRLLTYAADDCDQDWHDPQQPWLSQAACS